MRFRVIELLMVTAVIAIAIGCLRSPTQWASNTFASFVVLGFLTAVVMAIGSTGTPKYFWIGFAVIGLTCAHSTNLTKGTDRAGGAVVHAGLVETFVTRLITPYPDYSQGMMLGMSGAMSPMGAMPAMGGGGLGPGGSAAPLNGGSGNPLSRNAYQSAICTTHTLISFLLAWIGGHMCCFARRRSGE